jgi:hypothetical protein
MIAASSGNTVFGLFLMDVNAFGQRDQMSVGAIYGSSGFSGLAMYNHTPNRAGLPGWNAAVSYGHRESEDLDRYETVHRRYSTNQFRLSLGINYPFNNLFSGSTSLSFTNISLAENENPLNPPEKGAMLLGFSPSLSLRRSSWDGFLLSQQSLSLRYGYNYALLGSSFHQVDIRGVFEQSFIPGFRAGLRAGLVWRSHGDTSTNTLFEYSPQSVNINILPQGFSARNYASLSAGLEKHLIQFRWGSLSALGSWQSVFSYGSISGEQFDHGPSGGLRLYLSRVALPAMSLNFAYNMNSGLYQAGFNLGMEL